MNKREFDVALAKLGISALGLSHQLGISSSLLSKWRNWGNVPNKYRPILSQALKISPRTLFQKHTKKGNLK